MKSTLTKILSYFLIVGLSLGSGVFAYASIQAPNHDLARSTTQTIAVAAQPEVIPDLVIIQPTMVCGTTNVGVNNLIQTTSSVNLNQLTDCFTISIASVPKLPSLAIAQPMPLPELVVAHEPAWVPNDFNQEEKQQSTPAVMVNLVLAILLIGSVRLVKRIAKATVNQVTAQHSLALSELQVYRC